MIVVRKEAAARETETQRSIMKTTVLEAIEFQGEKMASVGYFEGVLVTLWAEIAVEQNQDTESWNLFWNMRKNLGSEN